MKTSGIRARATIRLIRTVLVNIISEQPSENQLALHSMSMHANNGLQELIMSYFHAIDLNGDAYPIDSYCADNDRSAANIDFAWK